MRDMFRLRIQDGRLPRDRRIYIILGLTVLVLALLMPRARQFEYSYRKGSPWHYPNLVADMDFPIYKTQAQMQEELSGAASELIPYYKYSEDLTARSLSAVESLEFPSGAARQSVLTALRRIYAQGVLPEESLPRRNSEYSRELLYIQKDKRAAKYPSSEVFRLSDVKPRLIADLSAGMPGLNADSLLRHSGVYENIVSNLVFDAQTTDLVHADSDVTVSPTSGYVSSGTLIVSEGEIVTAEIQQMLDSYKREYEALTGADLPFAALAFGNLLIALLLVAVLFLVLQSAAPDVLRDRRRLLFMVFSFLLAAVPVFLLGGGDVPDRYYFYIPFTLIALYLQSFFLDRIIVPVYLASLLPLLVAAPQGAPVYVMFAVAGLVAIFFFGRFFRAGQQFITALITFLVLLLSYFAFRLLSVFTGPVLRDVSALFFSSLLSVAAYPLIYLFENVFGLLSNSTLEQLSDPGNKLLRELETKAPGTFQHSLQVMNMAESAARSIGADVYLIRAGALYHDIGKMLNPGCFVENESIVSEGSEMKYHESLTPAQSAADIIRHVTDGVGLAQSRRLPKDVIDFILTHHGTSCTGYFYTKYLNEGGDPAGKADFCYPGPRPRTREQAVLMICDSVEAASRSLKDYTPKAFGDLVDRLVDDKLSDGQFSDSDLSMRELETVKDSVKAYLAQIYHERVQYPKLREQTK